MNRTSGINLRAVHVRTHILLTHAHIHPYTYKEEEEEFQEKERRKERRKRRRRKRRWWRRVLTLFFLQLKFLRLSLFCLE